MKKFRVRVERVFEYEVQAEDEDSAIDAICEGKGDEVDVETMDMCANEINEGETK